MIERGANVSVDFTYINTEKSRVRVYFFEY